jgi:hypothetical protein
MLREIKDFLKDKRKAGLDEISAHLNLDKELVLHGLYILVQKGKVREQHINVCGSCSCFCAGSCTNNNTVIYRIIVN